MATAEIKTLTSADGSTILYPRTTAEAVSGIENSFVPNSRTINGKSLSHDIQLTASDVGATSFTTGTITIAVEDWNSSTTAIKTDISYVTASNTLVVAPAPNSYTTWGNSKVRASAQATGSITFTCDTTPTDTIFVNVVALG